MDTSTEILFRELETTPQDWSLRRNLVRKLFDEGRVEQSADLLRDGGEIPNNEEDILLAADIFADLEPVLARSMIDRILRDEPNHPKANYIKSRALLASGESMSAASHYLRATSNDRELTDYTLTSRLLEAGALQKTGRIKLIPDSINHGQVVPDVEPPQVITRVTTKRVTGNVERSSPRKRPKVVPSYSFPGPGEFPTMSAAEVVPVAPLVDPEDVPDYPEMRWRPEVVYVRPNVNTASHCRALKIPTSNIPRRKILQVVAPVTDSGELVAPVQLSVDQKQPKSDRIRHKAARRDAMVSLLFTVCIHLAAIAALLPFVIDLPRNSPQIVAIGHVSDLQQVPMLKRMEKIQSLPAAPAMASASLVVTNMVSTLGRSDFAFPDLPEEGELADALASQMTSFGMSAQFGTDHSLEKGMIFGTKIQGKRLG